MKTFALLLFVVTCVFFAGCKDDTLGPSLGSGTSAKDAMVITSAVKNNSVEEISYPMTLKATGQVRLVPITSDADPYGLTKIYDLYLCCDGTLLGPEPEEGAIDCGCINCKPLCYYGRIDLGKTPNTKIFKRYTVPSIGPTVELTLEYSLTNQEVQFISASLGHTQE